MDFNCTVCRLAKLGCPYFKAGAKVHDLLNEIFVSRERNQHRLDCNNSCTIRIVGALNVLYTELRW